MNLRDCKHCGQGFEPNPYTDRHSLKRGRDVQRFCSPACVSASRFRPETRVGATCARCGDGFEYRTSVPRGRKYCSKECARTAPAKASRHCEQCGGTFSDIPSVVADRRFCSRECASAHLTIHRVDDARTRFGKKRWECIRQEVLKRDGRACVDCGKSGGRLHVHHILRWNGDPARDRPENLVTLCGACHRMRHVRERREAA